MVIEEVVGVEVGESEGVVGGLVVIYICNVFFRLVMTIHYQS